MTGGGKHSDDDRPPGTHPVSPMPRLARPAMRRAITVFIAGLIVAVVFLPFVTWALALAVGRNAAAFTFHLTIWLVITRADSSHAPQLAAREDQTAGYARVLLAGVVHRLRHDRGGRGHRAEQVQGSGRNRLLRRGRRLAPGWMAASRAARSASSRAVLPPVSR